jgi:hypothetical protein
VICRSRACGEAVEIEKIAGDVKRRDLAAPVPQILVAAHHPVEQQQRLIEHLALADDGVPRRKFANLADQAAQRGGLGIADGIARAQLQQKLLDHRRPPPSARGAELESVREAHRG